MSPPVAPPRNAGDALIDPALVARFRRDVEAALSRTVDRQDRIALAVSGGPDSMAMLVLAANAFPGVVIAATVDHRLRPESTDEAAMVAAWCASNDVPHDTLSTDEPPAGASVQARARGLRYALLDDWVRRRNATILLTAHHADDQAETFLMRAARGSGLPGLAAIRGARDFAGGFSLLRPLLEWRRHELRSIAMTAGAPFVDDPSNRSDAYDRTRFRKLLEDNPWLNVEAIARCAGHLAEAESALIASADMLWDDLAIVDGDGVSIDARDLPRDLRRRLVRSAITFVRHRTKTDRPAWRDGANVEPMLDSLIAGERATQAGVMVTPRDGIWHFTLAPPRRSP